MRNRKPKSKISIKNMLRSKKTALIAGIGCLAAFGVYFGVHTFPSQADGCKVTRGQVNSLEDIAGKTCDRNEVGTEKNPFLVLEIVPWVGYAEFGYMIEGCEPVDYASMYTGTAAKGFDNIQTGVAVEKCFEEEDYPGKGKTVDEEPAKWTKVEQELTMTGYYEKVGEGEGSFTYNGDNVADDSFVSDKTVYRPVFENVGEGNGDFIWVTLNIATDGSFAKRQKLENKYTEEKDGEIVYSVGDREYTTRTEDHYYDMGSMSYAKAKFQYYNDFLRSSLQVRSKKKIDNYCVVVKTIEPSELNKNPEWIDNADLIFCHTSTSYGTVKDFWNDADDAHKKITTKTSTYEGAGFGYGTGEWADKQNDVSWEVAERMFMKVNGLGDFDQETYAPIVFDTNIYQKTGQYDKKTITNYLLDYEDMTCSQTKMNSEAYNNNLYKFSIMDLLMDQDNFYDLFYSKLESTGKPVIQTKEGEGICAPQSGDAQKYWNVYTFLPDNNAVGHWKDFKDKYDLTCGSGGNSFFNFPGNTGIRKSTLTYHGTGFMTYFINSSEVQSNEFTDEAFEWFENEMKDPHSELSPADVIYYMLNYKKSDDNTNGSRKKKEFRILNIEPCNDFSTLTKDYLRALFPASKYKCKFIIDTMTTAEFNGSKKALNSNYDMIYIGDNIGKFNSDTSRLDHGSLGGWKDTEDTRYNDMGELIGKIYLHVGDLIKNGTDSYRLSGNDITSIRRQDLISYAKAGHSLVMADVLYAYQSSSNPLYVRNVDITSNLDQCISKVKSRKNVISLTALSQKNLVSTDYLGAPVEITSYPQEYYNPVDQDMVNVGEDEEEEEETPAVKSVLSGNKLQFEFEIGYSDSDDVYAVKLLVDSNGDGMITDGENGSEIVDSWDSNVQTGGVYKSGTLNEDGEEVPAKYNATYTIPSDRMNGAIAWKFMVYNTSNENIYTEKSGISWYQGNMDKEGKKKVTQLKILQIISDEEYKKDSEANLEKELTRSGLFAKYAKDLDDYEITVKTVPLNSGITDDPDKMGYLESFDYVNSEGYDETSNARATFEQGGDFYYPSAYQDYNVYLISCGEEFQSADNSNGAVAFASWLSENGKSVIYTQDSIYATEDEGVQAVQKKLKDSAGLSRFTSASTSNQEYNDTPTYATEAGAKKEYSPEDYESLEQTYYALTRRGDTSNTYLPFKNSLFKEVDASAQIGYGVGKQSSKEASRINQGTVCVYPYTIAKKIKLAGTQAQDYQLNLENPMADVWYCLAGAEDTVYGISPNDASNNYYLYNVENVFYSGIRLETVSGSQEMQLFINTLVGAYEASYGAPYVTADEVKNIEESTAKDVELTLKKATEERRIYEFSVTGVNEEIVKDTEYKEYMAQATRIPVSSPTPAPEATAEPTPEPSEAPEPSAEPVPTVTPYTIWENQFESTGAKCEVKRADWMTGLSNDAVIQFRYRCKNETNAADYVLECYGGYDDWKHGAYFTACAGASESATEVQTVRMTIGEFKQSFTERPVALTDDLEYILIQPYNWNSNVVLLSLRLYDEGYTGDYEDSVTEEPEEPKKEADETDVTGTGFVKKTDTHKIYFTPYDGNLTGGRIKEFTAVFTDGKNGEETATMPITSIYREVHQADGGKRTMMMNSPEEKPGQYLEADNLFLTDSVQYFMLYNKTYVNQFPYIRFTIRNKKKESVTYIEVDDMITTTVDKSEVYMFNLD